MPAKSCPVCGSAIVGRSDKIYCSDKCRFRINNAAKAESEKPILSINATLRKNRSILKSLCPEGTTMVTRQVLTSMGYDVQYFTSIYVTQRRDVYYFCYDYGFMPIIKDGTARALIVKRDKLVFRDPWQWAKQQSPKGN